MAEEKMWVKDRQEKRKFLICQVVETTFEVWEKMSVFELEVVAILMVFLFQ